MLFYSKILLFVVFFIAGYTISNQSKIHKSIINKRSIASSCNMNFNSNCLIDRFSEAIPKIPFDQNFIDSNNISSVEDFLNIIPNEFKYRYVIVYKSMSLQQSSFLFPRVIMYNKRGDQVITFNGDPQHHGYNSIELMEFYDDRYHFSNFIFEGGKGKYNKSPPECLTCHTQDARPNWAPYSLWERVYGSDHQKMKRPNSDYNANETYELEEKMFNKFVKTKVKKNHPRYKHILDLPDKGLLSMSDYNLMFNIVLFPHDAKRLRRILQSFEYYQEYKYAILGSFICSDENFPNPQGIAIDDQNYNQFFWSEYKFFPDNLLQWHSKRVKPPEKHGYMVTRIDEIMTNLHFIVQPYGMETSNWSNVFFTDGFNFNKYTYAFGQGSYFRDEIAQSDPDLKSMIDAHTQNQPISNQTYLGSVEKNKICSQLAEKSLQALQRRIN